MKNDFLSLNNVSFDHVITSQDILRIEDFKKDIFETPFKKNAKWIHALVGEPILDAVGFMPHRFIYGDEGGKESLRWNIYSNLRMPFCTNSWAKLYAYNKDAYNILEYNIVRCFKDALVLSFEMPESILDIFTKNNIAYIDFSNHPIRFLPDYMLGIRTNVKEWYDRIKENSIDEEIVYEFARITRAKAVRIDVFNKIKECSVLFLGQMPIDSSLIYEGQIATEELVKEEILKAATQYHNVMYKPHPHNKNAGEIVKFCSSINVDIADYNIYDCFGSGKFAKIIGLSSGGIYESKYFNIDNERLLKKKYYFEDRDDESLFYIPVYESFVRKDFWQYIVNGNLLFEKKVINPYEGAMKFSLQMKWGR